MKGKSKKNPHMGSSLDDFLKEQGIYEECREGAFKQALAEELEQVIQRKKLTRTQAAAVLKTSRSGLDNILDRNKRAISLNTIMKVLDFVELDITLTPR